MATTPVLISGLPSGFGFLGPKIDSYRQLYLGLAIPAHLSSTTNGWDDARSRARSLGGDLAVIDSGLEQSFISDNLLALSILPSRDSAYQPLRNYFIGLTDTDPTSTKRWTWANGSALTAGQSYSNWAQGQPDDSFGGQDKAVLWGVNTTSTGTFEPRSGASLFQWDDVGNANISRGDVSYALAEVPLRAWNGSLYQLIPCTSADDAKAQAISLGGSLASIDSQEEYDFLNSFLKADEGAWITTGTFAAILSSANPAPQASAVKLALVEVKPSDTGGPSTPTSSVYVKDVMWPQTRSYGWNDEIPVTLQLSAPLDLRYNGQLLSNLISNSTDKPYQLPVLTTFSFQLPGEALPTRTITQAINLSDNSTWPATSLTTHLYARDLAPNGTTTATNNVTVSLQSAKLDLNGTNPAVGDVWDFSAFSQASGTNLDLTIPARQRAGLGGFGVAAPPQVPAVRIVAIQPPVAGTYQWGESLNFVVSFDQAVYGETGGEPSLLLLDIGGQMVEAREVPATDGSPASNNPKQHLYRYTLTNADASDSDGISITGFKPGSLYGYNQGIYPPISNQLPGNASSIPYSGVRTALNRPALQQDLQLNGTAQWIQPSEGNSSRILRLTEAQAWQAGSAFLKNSVTLKADASFSTAFKFRMNSPGGISDDDGSGADGLVFTVQTNANNVGGSGAGIGYEAINRSVGIEFDTYNNGASDQNSGNHVGIDVNGSLTSIALAPIGKRLNDGDIWSAWVDYNGSTDQLDVRLSSTAERPAQPLLTATVDLPTVLGSSNAFVGFTSATGSAWGNHDILAWDFKASYAPVTLPPDSSLPRYSLNPANSTVREGENVVLTVQANQAPANTTVYWQATSLWPAGKPSRVGTNLAGSVALAAPTGSTGSTVQSATITLPTTSTTAIEGSETIVFALYADAEHRIPLQADTAITVADVALQTLPLVRSSTPAYYLDLGNVYGNFDQSQDPSKKEPVIEGKPLGQWFDQTAGAKLGPWLKDPLTAIGNGQWSSQPIAIPGYQGAATNPWPEGTENASMMLVDGGPYGVANLKADIGIDNMIFIWINGEYRYGAYSPVHYDPANLPLKNVDLGPLRPGPNTIQILRSDEFGWAGADWTIREDDVTGAPLDLDRDGAVNDLDTQLMMRAMLGTYPGDALSQGISRAESLAPGARAALHRRAYDALTMASGVSGASANEAAMDLDGNGTVRLFSDGLLLQRFQGGGLQRDTPPQQLNPLLGPNFRHNDPGILLDRIQFGLVPIMLEEHQL